MQGHPSEKSRPRDLPDAEAQTTAGMTIYKGA